MEGVLYVIIKCQQQMGIFLIYSFWHKWRNSTNGHFEKQNVYKDGCFSFWCCVFFLIFEMPTLFSFLFYYDIFGMYLVGTTVGRFSLFQWEPLWFSVWFSEWELKVFRLGDNLLEKILVNSCSSQNWFFENLRVSVEFMCDNL